MSVEANVSRLRDLHEKRKLDVLDVDERATYEALREAFAAAFVRANRVSLRPGQTSRQAVRAQCAFQVELAALGRVHKTITLDLSGHGFAALVGIQLDVGTECAFVLRIRPELIRGTGRVVSCARYGSGNSSYRVSFAFNPLGASDVERVELVVFDAALASLGAR
jgi:hypothetical protein